MKKLDKQTSRIIIHWIEKNLYTSIDPRQHGKVLKGNYVGLWRYSVGNYRIIVDIKDDKLIVASIEVDHRKEIYK